MSAAVAAPPPGLGRDPQSLRLDPNRGLARSRSRLLPGFLHRLPSTDTVSGVIDVRSAGIGAAVGSGAGEGSAGRSDLAPAGDLV